MPIQGIWLSWSTESKRESMRDRAKLQVNILEMKVHLAKVSKQMLYLDKRIRHLFFFRQVYNIRNHLIEVQVLEDMKRREDMIWWGQKCRIVRAFRNLFLRIKKLKLNDISGSRMSWHQIQDSIMCTKHLIPEPNLSESEIKGVRNHQVYNQQKLVRDQDPLL